MENNQPNSEIIIYEGGNGQLSIRVRLVEENVWLSQQQIAELYQSSRTNIVEHIKHIYKDQEMDDLATCRKFRQVRMEGGRNVVGFACCKCSESRRSSGKSKRRI